MVMKTKAEIDIIEILKFIETSSLFGLEKLALKEETEDKLKLLLKDYFSYYLGIDKLKSEGLII